MNLAKLFEMQRELDNRKSGIRGVRRMNISGVDRMEIERLIDYFETKYDEINAERWDPYIRGQMDAFDDVISRLRELL